ncbi:MAG TPA: ribose 5-phosphate isomerase B [Polyangia bacterium]|nr:ribose 5-phosphate isomerase B [Polyangia bacterium]
MARIFMGGDHAGTDLRAHLKQTLTEWGHEVVDLGTSGHESVDYPDYAVAVGEHVARGEGVGLLVCGTGIGVDMAANKIQGVRSAHVSDCYSARMSRAHNDANVLCLGGRVVGEGLADLILKVWLDTPFEGGRHQRRVDKINALDAKRK